MFAVCVQTVTLDRRHKSTIHAIAIVTFRICSPSWTSILKSLTMNYLDGLAQFRHCAWVSRQLALLWKELACVVHAPCFSGLASERFFRFALLALESGQDQETCSLKSPRSSIGSPWCTKCVQVSKNKNIRLDFIAFPYFSRVPPWGVAFECLYYL